MTIMETRTHALTDQVHNFVGHALFDADLDLYSESAVDFSKRIVIVSIDDHHLKAIDLLNPDLAHVKDDVKSAIEFSSQNPRDLIIDVTMNDIAFQIQDMIDDRFMDDPGQVIYDFERGMEHVDLGTTVRAIIRAVITHPTFRVKYMTDSQVTRSVNNDEWTANASEVKKVTCPNCFMIRTPTGMCGCIDD